MKFLKPLLIKLADSAKFFTELWYMGMDIGRTMFCLILFEEELNPVFNFLLKFMSVASQVCAIARNFTTPPPTQIRTFIDF